MKLVGVDTSTKTGSVALLDNDNLVDELSSPVGESFSRSLLAMIERLLTKNGIGLDTLSGFGVAIGPGSFTGIRIGLSTIRGITLSKRLPIYGISSLEAMARTVRSGQEGILAPMLDAGDGEVYYSKFCYDDGALVRMCADSAAPLLDALQPDPSATCAFGSGADRYREEIAEGGGQFMEGSRNSVAEGVAKAAYLKMAAGDEGDKQGLKPNYIRRGQVKKGVKSFN